MGLPRISNYGRYSSDNYGAHCLKVDMGPVTLWFSYKTCVAFHVDGHPMVVRENEWRPTTGKYLNWIDGGRKSDRVDSETFERLYNEQVLPAIGAEAEPSLF